MKKIVITICLGLLYSFAIGQNEMSIKVSGECDMCKMRIEETASNTPGILSGVWTSEDQLLKITFDPTSFQEDSLHVNLARVGHDTDKKLATLQAYNDLPACCLYREDNENAIYGRILELDGKEKIALIGANVYWLDGTLGTTTDVEGAFYLPMNSGSGKLVVSYIGYQSDTLDIEKSGHVEIILDGSTLLDEIEVVRRKRSTSVSYIQPIKVKQIDRKELLKAACCNLSESFETNPSVDVSFSDAVTGTRVLEMLGLSGPYIQITRENIPDIRGLAALSGFTYIPGPWVSGIQMNLGAGSVLSGYESIAGQINVELKKPWDEERIHLNGYQNNGGRSELNAVVNQHVNKKFDTGLSLHYSQNQIEQDRNQDGYLDMPNNRFFIASNNWKYTGNEGNEGMMGFKITTTEMVAGQVTDENLSNPWQANSDVDRYEVWVKRGKVFLDRPYASIGLQLGGTYHDQKSFYGNTRYDGTQKTLYANLLYQTIISDTDHKITFGSSFLMDEVDEFIFDKTYQRREYVPGVFGEYSEEFNEHFSLVAGIRGDYHNNYGFFVTPRLHLRFAPNEHDVFRVSAGRGQRTASIFAENVGALASNRVWKIRTNGTDTPYGLPAEIAYNLGLSHQRCFEFVGGELDWTTDLYYTRFTNQIVVDYDQNPQELNLYALDGNSYSTSLQTELNLALENGFDLRVAYRYNDVKTQYDQGLLARPLISPHRAFANAAYNLNDKWSFDYTLNWQSSKRLPSTAENPHEYHREDQSPSYFLSHAQVTKRWKKFDLYIGGENLFNFRQQNPILSAEDPNSPFFDSSMVWGPIFGRTFYAGFRYTISRSQNEMELHGL